MLQGDDGSTPSCEAILVLQLFMFLMGIEQTTSEFVYMSNMDNTVYITVMEVSKCPNNVIQYYSNGDMLKPYVDKHWRYLTNIMHYLGSTSTINDVSY